MTCGRTTRATQAGFTLTEILFTSAIATFVLAGVLTSYIFSIKGFRSLSNYNEEQADGRRALDWFARDLRAGIAIASCTSTQLVALLPAAVDSQGQVTSVNQVTHKWQNGKWYRAVSTTGSTTLLAENVTQITFTLYDAAGIVTTQTNRAVSAQVDAVLAKSVLGKQQSADHLSARLRMRNTP